MGAGQSASTQIATPLRAAPPCARGLQRRAHEPLLLGETEEGQPIVETESQRERRIELMNTSSGTIQARFRGKQSRKGTHKMLHEKRAHEARLRKEQLDRENELHLENQRLREQAERDIEERAREMHEHAEERKRKEVEAEEAKRQAALREEEEAIAAMAAIQARTSRVTVA